jgi:tetratricopeptide (TPR) repeat protein
MARAEGERGVSNFAQEANCKRESGQNPISLHFEKSNPKNSTSVSRVLLRAILVPITLICGSALAQLTNDARMCFGDSAGADIIVRHCTLAIESGQLSPGNHAIALLRRAGIHRRNGNSDLALADIDRALLLTPDNAAARYDRGITNYIRGRPDLAVGDFSAVISLWPESAEAFDSRGKAHSVIGAFDKALADFDHAIELSPDSADYYSNRGSIYFKLGDHDRAVTDFDEAIRLDSNHVAALYNRGMAHAARERRQMAIMDFRRANELAPGNAAIQSRLRELGATD